MERRLVFYLALEDYVARETDIPEAFFLWRVPPTVIFGRNQDMEAEVNTQWCRDNGVQFYRRKSGGGCVYADMGNIMTSYIVSGENVGEIFRSYLERMAALLRTLGLPAEVSGRNDILVDGRKVSGNAFHALPGRSIVHGTLLYDVDFSAMENAITPSETKLSSKGIASVRQRVANLRESLSSGAAEHGIRDAEDLKRYVEKEFGTETYMLNAQEIKRVEEIEATYLDPAFIAGGDSRRTGWT